MLGLAGYNCLLCGGAIQSVLNNAKYGAADAHAKYCDASNLDRRCCVGQETGSWPRASQRQSIGNVEVRCCPFAANRQATLVPEQAKRSVAARWEMTGRSPP